jgi:cob(I)alamin adenosyltransferase
MLEAGAIEQTIKNIKTTLKEAQETLKIRTPNIADLDIDNISPETAVAELKRSTFKVLKEIEMHLWESGQSIKLSKEEEEEFLKSNPDMIEARKDWVDTLQKANTELNSTFEYAKTQPKVERKKPKIKEEREHTIDEPEPDMVAA